MVNLRVFRADAITALMLADIEPNAEQQAYIDGEVEAILRRPGVRRVRNGVTKQYRWEVISCALRAALKTVGL